MFFTTPSKGAVTNFGLEGTTSTGAVLFILIGIIEIIINIMAVNQKLLPPKIVLKNRLTLKFFVNEF